MKRVALYVRVSSEEQKLHGYSVDSQITALEEYCKDNDYKIVDIYNDAGISAHRSYKKRPALLKLIDDCVNDKVDMILFTKLDRWFRSVADYYDVQRQLDKTNVVWKCIWEDYETETSAGRFKVNIMLSVAQSESERTSERLKKVNEYKLSQGQVVSGGVSLGYVIENKRWKKDEATREGVEFFFRSYLTNFSIITTLELCRQNGYIFSHHNAYRFLRRPCYYAEPSYVPNSEAYITVEEHEAIAKTLKKATRNRKHTGIFTGLLRCAHCNGSVTHIASKYKDDTKLNYLCSSRNTDKWSCVGASINELFLEEYLLNNIENLLEEYTLKIEVLPRATDNKQQIHNVESRLQRIKDLYEFGDITRDEYLEKRQLLNDKLESLQVDVIDKVPILPSNWKEVYSELDRIHKRAFWSSLIDKIVIEGRHCKNPIIYFTH